MAGCAGFAAILSPSSGPEAPGAGDGGAGAQIVCDPGARNPITRRRLDWGERVGYPRIYMAAEEKLNPEFWKSEQGAGLTRRLTQESSEK